MHFNKIRAVAPLALAIGAIVAGALATAQAGADYASPTTANVSILSAAPVGSGVIQCAFKNVTIVVPAPGSVNTPVRTPIKSASGSVTQGARLPSKSASLTVSVSGTSSLQAQLADPSAVQPGTSQQCATLSVSANVNH